VDPIKLLEKRLASLERSLRRSRRVSAALGLGCVVAVAAALVPQVPAAPTAAERQADPAEQTQELLRTQGLVLTNELDVEMIVLRAGTDGSLVVQTPDGGEIVRLGGPAARRIGH